MASQSSRLQHIIDRAYQLFKRYRATAPLDVCTFCCITEQQERELVSLSLRHIPFKLLYDYNTAAKTEKPSLEEFKYFIPRFLELTAHDQFVHHSAELVLSRFCYYAQADFTPDEQALFQEYAEAYFEHCLNYYPLVDIETIDAIIIMLGKMKVNLKDVLNQWTYGISREKALHLSDLLNWGISNKDGKLSSPFAEDYINTQVVEWMDSCIALAKLCPLIEHMIMKPEALEDAQLSQLSYTYEWLSFKQKQ